MTQNLAIEIVGDCWSNPHSFVDQLRLCTTPNVVIDLRSEGPSLAELGIAETIDQWLIETKRSPEAVTLIRWSNPVEQFPYNRNMCSEISHFFAMSQDYWMPKPHFVDSVNENVKLFALLIGRLSVARACILYQAATQYGRHFVLSKMPSKEFKTWDIDVSKVKLADNIDHWLPRHEQMQMIRWYDTSCPGSIDNLTVQDQFRTPTSYIDTNRSILNSYTKFAIEVVAETYCRGQTFFPTEKTIRPLMALKPMLVYGPKYFLARLRNLGFKTWNSLWDESYDLLEGPARWERIKLTMNELIGAGEQQQNQILNQARSICWHNRKRLVELVGKARIIEPWMTEHDNP
jgi:hypothetical protein